MLAYSSDVSQRILEKKSRKNKTFNVLLLMRSNTLDELYKPVLNRCSTVQKKNCPGLNLCSSKAKRNRPVVHWRLETSVVESASYQKPTKLVVDSSPLKTQHLKKHV